MKYIILSACFAMFIGASCRKNKTKTGLEKLPPVTQIGANTFGCLMDGKVFLPKGPSLSPILTCYYQYIYYPSPTGFVFQVAAVNKSEPSLFQSINIGCDSVKLIEGHSYELRKSDKDFSRGNYVKAINDNSTYDNYFTYPLSSGQLILTKFDEINQIASDTFRFNVVDVNGDTVHGTNGRFDMQFTK